MYGLVQDLVDRIGQEVLEDLAEGAVVAAPESEGYRRVVRALESATNLIDSYVQTRYPVPLTPVPPVVRDKATDIALYQLGSWRGIDPEDASGKVLIANYRSAERWLQDVAKGTVTLGPAPAAPPPGGVEISSRPRVFSRDRLKEW